MNSLPFDWQARRFVETNVNFFILEGLRVPALSDADYDAIAEAAARLSAVDDRFADFAAAVGVSCGPLDPAERQQLLVDTDARVARAWNLTVGDMEVIFGDFTHQGRRDARIPGGGGGADGGAGVRDRAPITRSESEERVRRFGTPTHLHTHTRLSTQGTSSRDAISTATARCRDRRP